MNNGDIVQTKDSESKQIKNSKPVKPMAKPENVEDNVIVPDYNGTFLPIGGVNEMLHPEMYAQGSFRRGQLTVVGEETYLNRKVTLIKVDYTESKIGIVKSSG